MIKKTAAAILLGATLLTSPLHAEPTAPSQAPAATEKAALQAEAGLKGVPAVKPELVDDDLNRLDLKYAKGYLTDGARLATSPLRWESNDWLKLGLVVGSTASLFFVDGEVNRFAQRNQNSVATGFAEFGNTIGNPLTAFPALGAYYLYGHLADDSRARRTSLLALESMTMASLITSVHKSIASRHRPESGDGPWSWDGPSLSSKNVSFCSGHTSSAFSIATVFADQYRDNPYVPPVAYGLASFVGLSRIYSNKHWLSDTFFGAAVGYFTSKAILSYHKREKNDSLSRLSIQPEVSREMTGLTVKYDF